MYSGNENHLPSTQLYIYRRNQTAAQRVNTLLIGLEAPRRLILTLSPLIAGLSVCVCVCVCVCEEAVACDHFQFLYTEPERSVPKARLLI
jgi:hypothetical protein